MGWKMLHTFLGIDEKTQRNLITFNQNIRTVYSNIRAVYPNKNHVTTHLVCTEQRNLDYAILNLSGVL